MVWGLQTAETLWKRGERIDAVVWLRRAATAAGEASDDDRAFELARSAAELTDWMATLPPGMTQAPPPPPSSPSYSDGDREAGPLPSYPMPDPERPAPPNFHAPSAPTMQTASPAFADEGIDYDGNAVAVPTEPPPPSTRGLDPGEHAPSVLPAEKVHAGMYNPWDDRSSSMPDTRSTRSGEEEEERLGGDDEVITSVGPQPGAEAPVQAAPPPAPPVPAAAPSAPARPGAGRPPPLPPRAMKPKAPPQAPSPVRVASEPPAAAPPSEPAQPVIAPPAAANAAARGEPEKASPAPAPVPNKLDLDQVDAFSDLPDDARAAFAAAAEVSVLGEGEEVSSFALAYIVSGTVDVAATMVDAPAARLATGAVLRARGTLEEGVPMRLIGVASGIVATWTDVAVKEAFRTCPWVEEDLRVAADRLQTLVGVTIGPLGERLDASIREQIIGRLTMRTLAAGEIVVNAGEPVPGLLLVGVGQLDLVDGDAVSGFVGSGEFLFAGEVLGAGAAPRTARAGAGGALILQGDRMVAQELLVTCPPLLEVFAGM